MSLISAARKSRKIKELLRLHNELKKHGLDAVFVPKRVLKALQIYEKGDHKIIALYGRYGSGKTGVLVASYLYLKDKRRIVKNPYIGTLEELLKEDDPLAFDGLFLDELDRAFELLKEDVERKAGMIVRSYAERDRPIVLVVKEPEVVDTIIRESGGAISIGDVERIDLQSPGIRKEINEFLLNRNIRIVEIEEGVSLEDVKRELMSEREMFDRVPPRAFNFATLAVREGVMFDQGLVEKELESYVRKYFAYHYSPPKYVVAKNVYMLERVNVIAGEKHGPDVTLELAVKAGEEVLKVLRIGIEVKTSAGRAKISMDQYKSFLETHDALVYFVFHERYDPDLVRNLKRENVEVIQLPRKISYVSTADNVSFFDYMNACLAENDPIKKIIRSVISKSKEIAESKEAKEEAERILNEIINYLLKRAEEIRTMGKQSVRPRISTIASIANKSFGLNLTEEEMREFLKERQEEIKNRLAEKGYKVKVANKYVIVRRRGVAIYKHLTRFSI